MASDLPPPYTALTRHPMMPRTRHDEAARFNFLIHFNRYLSGAIGSGNALAYERRVLPAFRAEHGRDPEHRYEIREAMNRDPWHRAWSALKRNSMEMRQHTGRQVVLRQLDELDAEARRLNAGSDLLETRRQGRPAVLPNGGRYPLSAGRLPFGGTHRRRHGGGQLRCRAVRDHRRCSGRAQRWRWAGAGRMGQARTPRLDAPAAFSISAAPWGTTPCRSRWPFPIQK